MIFHDNMLDHVTVTGRQSSVRMTYTHSSNNNKDEKRRVRGEQK
jgi:hypothetical protein